MNILLDRSFGKEFIRMGWSESRRDFGVKGVRTRYNSNRNAYNERERCDSCVLPAHEVQLKDEEKIGCLMFDVWYGGYVVWDIWYLDVWYLVWCGVGYMVLRMEDEGWSTVFRSNDGWYFKKRKI